MNRNTVTRTLVMAGLTAAAGIAATVGATAAAASSTPVVYASHGAVYIKQTGHATRLTQDEVSKQPVLSPDATRIAYVHNDTVWVMNRDGSEQHQVSDRAGAAPRWEADGVRITYTATSCTGAPGTFRTGVNGGDTSEVMAPSACVSQDAPLVGFIMG
ncbi:hypothetical protein Dvina_26110 [Dactylosporangium vinaceum]|uniref:TolB family protein n=1 Tax=Dactylosporangium vinaceum TaxID=53362 RepID=A0ABV5M606_9ACTN|nr:hypothetical protein [Dactylosporangium vinaceum]UAC01213.1 hypothetical protein Dvina_26110 [Dactylosporangium vinaceum]